MSSFNSDYSFESFVVDRLKVYVRENLNDYIDMINSCYTDFKIDNLTDKEDAYQIYQEMTDPPNYQPFVIIDVGTESETISNCKDGALTILATILVARNIGNAKHEKEYRTNLRYMESVKAMMVDFGDEQLDSNVELRRIQPTAVYVNGVRDSLIGTGVEIRYTLG